VCVTVLSVMITPHPEWEMATQIRDGKITGFIVKPIGYYGYRFSQETSYQIIKSVMLLPALGIMLLLFHRDIQLPSIDAARFGLFLLAALLAYALLTQIKFLLGISAFWISEPGGFLELWNILTSVLGGRLLPMTELLVRFPWMGIVSTVLPFTPFPCEFSWARRGRRK
jgi:ABC-2 type transport system permease protein